MTLLSLLLTVAALPVLAAALYLAVLTWLGRRPLVAAVAPSATPTRFVLVVPAHDEAAGLPATLATLDALAWPAAQRRVLVVADNCSDDTAAIARAHGVEVLERQDQQRRGKGHALAAAFARLVAEPADRWDAVVVIDADTDVTPDLLQAAHARLVAGADALQAVYLSRPGAAPLQTITEVALYASHVLRGRARERLGLSVGLRGNGMVLSRRLLARLPYEAFSAVEDLEYGIQLARAGVRIGLLPETIVRGDMPSEAAVAATQRTRWIGGRAAVVRTELPGLLRDAVTRRSALLSDLAVDLLLPPLSLLVLLTVLGLGLSLVPLWDGHVLPVSLWGAAALLLAAHVAVAAAGAGRLAALGGVVRLLPKYVVTKAAIALRALVAPTTTWVRTARPSDAR
jgi:1,2-diacylglycerol 3-beta-glucosyltransferase